MWGQAHLFNKINNNAFIIYFSNKIKVIQVNIQIKVIKSVPLAQNKLRGTKRSGIAFVCKHKLSTQLILPQGNLHRRIKGPNVFFLLYSKA